MMEPIKPPRLRKGEVVGLICPASAPLKPHLIDRSMAYFEAHGYRVKLGANARREHGYLAGTDEERAADFNGMIRDHEVRAIFAVRGGYGTPRILPLIDYRAVRENPKIVCGFSDITALQLALLKKTGLVTFSGAMPGVDLWEEPEAYTEESFWRVLTSPEKLGIIQNPPDEPMKARFPGKAAGRFICGNLALVVSSVGTRFIPGLSKTILLVEDVDEQPYRLDRMFTQLRNAGILSTVGGLALGAFTRCEARDLSKPSLSRDEVLDDVIKWASVPAISDVQYGHIPTKLTLPIGVRAEIDGREGRLEIVESAVS